MPEGNISDVACVNALIFLWFGSDNEGRDFNVNV